MTPGLERPSTTRQRRRNRELATPNVDGSPLEGFIEFPVDGGEVERLTEVAGWHAWDVRPVAAVAIEVDGQVVGGARMGGRPRIDIAEERGDDRYAATGWAAAIDLRAIHSPTVELRATVYPGVDHPGVRLDPITVAVLGEPTFFEDGAPIPAPDEVRGRLDVPAHGASVELGAVLVRGWSRCTSSPIGHVALTANGVALGRARLGIDRADVAAADPAFDAPLCGFEQVVDLSVLGTATAATIVATPVALDGTTAEFAVDVTVTPARTQPVRPSTLEPSPTPSAARGAFDLLVVTHDLGFGGAQLWLHEALARIGAGRDFPCSLVAFGAGPLAGELERLGIEVHVSSPLPVDDAVAYEGRLAELDAWLRPAHSVALVNTFRAFPGADLAERRGLPVVWAVHESWPESLIWAFDHPGVAIDPRVRATASSALARAGAVIFESAATRSLYENRAHGRTAFVPYGIDTAALDRFAASTSRTDARRTLGLPEEGRILLAVGTIEPRKGQTLVAEAFADVAARHPGVTMAFVGDLDTAYSAALRTFVGRAGLTDRVRVESVTPDVATWYRAADALVCGSDVESLPRSVLDAMCLGLPVVATAVFGLGELLTDGETGLLFDANDLGSAIEALERALTMPPDALAAIAARGSALVHEHHDAAGYAADVLALLRGLHTAPSASPADLLAGARTRVGAAAQSARS